jgi:hypothetical protein
VIWPYISDLMRAAFGDIDGDGDLDVVAMGVVVPDPDECEVCTREEMAVLINDGAGAFTDLRTAVPWGTGQNQAGSLVLVDLDGDGRDDLVTTEDGWYWPGLQLVVRRSAGDGAFEPAVLYPVANEWWIAPGDLDQDGDVDLLLSGVATWSEKPSSAIEAFLNDGTGQLINLSAQPTQGALYRLGDLDGDGALDAVGDGVLVMLGRGDGSFTDAVPHPIEGPWWSTYTGFGLGDLDGDGRADIAVTVYDELTNPLHLLFTEPAPAADIDGDGGVDIDDLLAVVVAWGPCPGGPAPCPADLDRSGAVDIDDLLEVILAWSRCP